MTVACSLPFHHPLSVLWGGGPRGDTGNDVIIGFVLRTLRMLLTEPAPQNSELFREKFQINGPILRHLEYQLTRLKKSP